MRYSTQVELVQIDGKMVPEIIQAWSEDQQLRVLAVRESGTQNPRFIYSSMDLDTQTQYLKSAELWDLMQVMVNIAEFMGVAGDTIY